MTDDELKRAKALCDGATDGPWENTELVVHPSFNAPNQPCVRADGQKVARMAVGGDEAAIAATFCTIGKYEIEKRNAAFIAAARTLLPAALDEIERLTDAKLYGEKVIAQVVAERDALAAQVEAMRPVVDEAAAWVRAVQAVGEYVAAHGSWRSAKLDALQGNELERGNRVRGAVDSYRTTTKEPAR